MAQKNADARQKSPSPAQVVAKLRRKPGKTAKELGTTTVVMNRYEAQGHVVKLDSTRKTDQRGRPAHEWGLPEQAPAQD